MNVDWARLCVLVALVCCVGLAVAAGSSIATSSTVPAANDSDPVVHLDPAEYDDDGDYDSLQAWFIDDLEDRLQRSSAAIAAGTIDDARVPLDETYVERVDQYETLVAETGAAGELDEADPLSEAQAGGPETPLETRSDDLEPADVVDAFEQTRVEQLALIEQSTATMTLKRHTNRRLTMATRLGPSSMLVNSIPWLPTLMWQPNDSQSIGR